MSQKEERDLTCRQCRHFQNDPQTLEASFKGMTVFSSGFASVRADDGLCAVQDIYLTPMPARHCPLFSLQQNLQHGISPNDVLQNTAQPAPSTDVSPLSPCVAR